LDAGQAKAPDPFGVVGVIFGAIAAICVLLGLVPFVLIGSSRDPEVAGAFAGVMLLGFGVFAAGPLAAIGALMSFAGRGNFRAAGMALNLIALVPSLCIGGWRATIAIKEHNREVAIRQAEDRRVREAEASARLAAEQRRAQEAEERRRYEEQQSEERKGKLVAEQKEREASRLAEAREREAKRRHELKVLEAKRQVEEEQRLTEKQRLEALEKERREAEEARLKREAWEKSPEGQAHRKREAEEAKKAAKKKVDDERIAVEENARKAAREKAEADENQAEKLLKLAQGVYKNGNAQRARERLQELIRDYPETVAAAVAKGLLESWGD
jgi:hypothetical protein